MYPFSSHMSLLSFFFALVLVIGVNSAHSACSDLYICTTRDNRARFLLPVKDVYRLDPTWESTRKFKTLENFVLQNFCERSRDYMN